jgi:hypothetical protein
MRPEEFAGAMFGALLAIAIIWVLDWLVKESE